MELEREGTRWKLVEQRCRPSLHGKAWVVMPVVDALPDLLIGSVGFMGDIKDSW